jgi:hypothetical protein
MMTFPHTTPNRSKDDHRPSILPVVVLIVCAIVLLPFTLLGLLWWGLSQLFSN